MIEEILDKHDDEYLKFERIPIEDRLHENKQLCGLLYVYKLMEDPTKFSLEAGHDVIWVCHPDWIRELTDEDAIYLQRCGIHYSSEYDCLSMFC